ncbi:UDP-N-acetylglucosamine 4,6-dehydratase [Flavobacteriaceae bacterium GSB9]|nr:UDP-N-acetylglucosamine 4,6-dehydratase [Flavobacteriaceae bacterium GSB9]
MNTTTAHQIDQLLIDSGLFQTQQKPTVYKEDFNFENDTILITGAAGTIGSELSKQVINGRFKQLVLVDMAESPLYELVKEFEFKDNIKFHLLNITDKKSLGFLFETYKPSLVFHAAAYKHVPLMEDHPFEAVKTNIFGTKWLADLSIENQVKKFVFISTDKAVNPVSVMGMTKRIAERYLISLNSRQKTAFFNARFGNILGSNGSVVPLFIKQFENHKPITITRKNISRYFICKRKACNLILKIALFDKINAGSFTFNMGQPIKIEHLIERLAKCFGKDINDIKVIYTGLRPGEKFFEDITTNNEILTQTTESDILFIKEKSHQKITEIDFSTFSQITPFASHTEAKSVLKNYF